MAGLRRWFGRLSQTDEDRLAAEIREWAESIPETRRIAGCPSREPVRVAGMVRRLRLRPLNGNSSLEAVVSDGTGELIASWLGRSYIPGLGLGVGVVLQGVVARSEDGLKMVNPGFEFA